MDRGRGRAEEKRHAIVLGAAAVERIVRGRYEWRDDGLKAADSTQTTGDTPVGDAVQ